VVEAAGESGDEAGVVAAREVLRARTVSTPSASHTSAKMKGFETLMMVVEHPLTSLPSHLVGMTTGRSAAGGAGPLHRRVKRHAAD
jgi:hypothetical protein